MVLTRWSDNSGTLVTPVNATLFSGSLQFPVATGELDFNVYAAIDADLGGIFALKPTRQIALVNWQVIVSLVLQNANSISAFGGNPIRRKIGSITYAQGLFAKDYEQVNYALQICKKQQFFFGEGLSEPSLAALGLPPIPEARDYLISPLSGFTSQTTESSQQFGATRALFSLNPAILGIAEVSYVASTFTVLSIADTASILVSQL